MTRQFRVLAVASGKPPDGKNGHPPPRSDDGALRDARGAASASRQRLRASSHHLDGRSDRSPCRPRDLTTSATRRTSRAVRIAPASPRRRRKDRTSRRTGKPSGATRARRTPTRRARLGAIPRARHPRTTPRGRHGAPLRRGVPEGRSGVSGATSPTDALECCQCLEIFKTTRHHRRLRRVGTCLLVQPHVLPRALGRAQVAARSLRAAPTRLDGREHEFEAAEGNGALWDARDSADTSWTSAHPRPTS